MTNGRTTGRSLRPLFFRAPTPTTAATLAALVGLVGCGPATEEGGTDTPTTSPTPTEASPTAIPSGGDFSSAVSGGSFNGGEPAPEQGDDDAAEGGDGEERSVEEADILAQVGDTLYILNTYRGLQVVDVTNPDAPDLKGRVPMVGYPVEMYVRDGRAYVVVSDYYTYWPMAEVGDAARSTDAIAPGPSTFRGSALAIIDVEDPNNPRLLGSIKLDGFVSQTRAVGDVIYAVSNRYAYYSCDGASEDTADMTSVISVDISDPANPHEVDSLTWEGTANQIHATSKSFYVAEPIYEWSEGGEGSSDGGEPADPPPAEGSSSSSSGGSSAPVPAPTATPNPEGEDGTPKPDSDEATPRPDGGEEDPVSGTSYYRTRLTYIDISDPHGQLTQRGSIEIQGQTWDKNALNEYDGTFRAVTQKYDGVSSATLTILDVSDPDNMTQLSELDIVLPLQEWVTAARFDGDRGYIVTAERTDPLFTVDLTDPSAPRLAGQVEMPGQLNHLETLGDRIVAFGQDNGEEGTWRFAVSLFDVTDMDAPTMLDRELIGDGQYSWSNATWDDKSFTLLPEEGLIAVPFTAYSYTEDDYYWTMTGGVQLLDYSANDMAVRGMVQHNGYVTRVRPVGDRLLSLSDSHLLMIDATNRDKPNVTADVSITRNVIDFMPGSNASVQLIGPDWYSSSDPEGKIRVVDPARPDEMDDALAELKASFVDGQMYQLGASGETVAFVFTDYDPTAGEYTYTSRVDVYDLSDPSQPALLSSTGLPTTVWSYYNSYSMYYGSTGGAMVTAGDKLAWLETYYVYDEVKPDEEDAPPSESGSGSSGGSSGGRFEAPEEDTWLTRLHVLDLSDPSSPRMNHVDFDQSLYGLGASGDLLYATHLEYIEGSDPYVARYYADLIDVTDPLNPAVRAPINIPGYVVDVRDNGATLLTMDSQWEVSPDDYQYTAYSLYALSVGANGRASVRSSVELPGYIYGAHLGEDAAFILAQPYWWEQTPTSECGYYYYGAPMELMAIDLSDLDALAVGSNQSLPVSWAYLRGADQGHLFIDGYTGGVLIYDLSNPLEPAYEDFAPTSGWVYRVRTHNTTAYMPVGMYGVATFGL